MPAEDYEELRFAGIPDRETIVALGAYWHDSIITWDAGKPIYKAVNRVHDAATDDTNWQIWKYTWDGSDCIRIEGPLPGSVDGQDSLNWGE